MKKDQSFLVYSYLRFSDPSQEDGDSVRRQTALRDGWLKRHSGARLDRSLGVLEDRGASGYHGDHRRGALGRFLAHVQAGKVPPGSVLLIENMDRLSREKPVIATHLLTSLLVADIRVVALSPDEVELTVDSDLFALLRGQLPQARGHDESKIKVERAKADAAEKKRRAREERTPYTAAVPAWVRMVGEVRNSKGKIVAPGRLELIPERKAAVKRIFKLAIDGYGLAGIVKRLTEEKVPPFGTAEVYVDREGRTRRRMKVGDRFGSGRWCRSNVGNILRDRRAVGEYRPHKRRGASGKREPDGPPVPDFFPAVVTEAEWLQARSGSVSRRWQRSEAGAHVSVFGKLLVNARDGESYYVDTRTELGKKTRVLRNMSALEGRAECVSFPYGTFEKAVLTMLAEVSPDVVAGRSDGAAELAALESERDGIQAELDSAKAYMARKGFSETIGDRITDLERRKADLAPRLADARARVESPAGVAWGEARNLMAALEEAKDQDDARRRLRGALARTVETIRLLVVPRGRDRLCAAQVWFKESGHFRIYHILHRPPHGMAREKVGRWWATAYRHPDPELDDWDGGSVVDLRSPKDVKEHVRVLMVYDPPAKPDDYPPPYTVSGTLP